MTTERDLHTINAKESEGTEKYPWFIFDFNSKVLYTVSVIKGYFRVGRYYSDGGEVKIEYTDISDEEIDALFYHVFPKPETSEEPLIK